MKVLVWLGCTARVRLVVVEVAEVVRWCIGCEGGCAGEVYLTSTSIGHLLLMIKDCFDERIGDELLQCSVLYKILKWRYLTLMN